MQVIAVPVKSLEVAKTRLSGVLTRPERAVLTLALFEDVLDACLAQAGWEVWTISRAEAVLEVAARRGARPVAERGRSLGEAVHQVEEGLRGRWSRLAVVLADLPLISPASLSSALALGAEAPVVAVPAVSDGGTNLLLRRPPSVVAARFGRSSFARHRAEADRAGIRFAEARLPQLGFDLDRPADLASLLSSGRPGRARTACLEMGLPERLAVNA